MTYLIGASSENLRQGINHKQYLEYLESVRHHLPRATYEFATADWHYDTTKPSCPHDAWVQEIRIRELAEGERHEIRTTQIEVILLGAFHDRLLKLTYKKVAAHSLISSQSHAGFGDWLIDEISLTKEGLITHYIRFANKAYLQIDCGDIDFEEQLTSQPHEATWK